MKTSIYAIRSLTALALLSILISHPSTSFAQGTAFNYQGRLDYNGGPAHGFFNFQFQIYSNATVGLPVSSVLTNNNVTVSNGLFNVALDFGSAPFNGRPLWMQLSVAPSNQPPVTLTVLSPRSPISPTPYAIYATTAGIASNAVNATTATTAGTATAVAANSVGAAALLSNSITASKIASGNVVKTLNGLTDNVTLSGGSNVTVTTTASNIIIAAAGGGGSASNAWLLLGNAGTTSNNFLGTTDNQPVEVRVNRTRALRLEPASSNTVNIIGGSAFNVVDPGVIGATISGGGGTNVTFGGNHTNRVSADFTTIGGGYGHTIGVAIDSTISGGRHNAIQVGSSRASIGGGQFNTIQNDAQNATISGGDFNTVLGVAVSATIGGGENNTNAGRYAAVPGGLKNLAGGDYSLAAGRRAKANNAGSFVWADSTDIDFISTANNQYLIRAGGGVGINTNNPGGYALNVLGPVCATSFSSAGLFTGDGSGLSNVWKTRGNSGTVSGVNYIGASDSAQVRLHATGGFLVDDPTPSISFGATSRQMLNLYNADFGFGVQNFTLYSRGTQFAWYQGGVHSDNENDPGTGGTGLMYLDFAGHLLVNAGVSVDTAAANDGTYYPGLVLGPNSGESIASKRTAGGNQFGLDFYTGFANQMSIANNGNVGIGTNSPQAKLHVNGAVIRVDGDHNQQAFIGGISAVGDEVLIGSSAGNIHAVNFWNTANAKQMDLHAASLTAHDVGVTGNYLEVFGGGNEQAYIGGDGVGNDVQVGSFNSTVSQVTLYNTITGYMDLYAKNASVCALTIRGGCDLAEPFQMSHEDIPKGSLVIIDEENPGKLKLAAQAYDTRVAGIVSGANGVNSGITLHQEGVIEGGQNVALSGRVYALADAASGSIKPGDLLTSSATPGHIMRVTDHAKAQGAIVGKAMSALKDGKGMVLVLVSLQ